MSAADSAAEVIRLLNVAIAAGERGDVDLLAHICAARRVAGDLADQVDAISRANVDAARAVRLLSEDLGQKLGTLHLLRVGNV